MGFWTRDHLITVLPAFLAFFIIALVMRILLIKKSYEIRMIPLKIIAVILVVIEIGKQICSASLGYNLYHIPLHFCSIFLYVIPLFAFYRGKGQENVRAISVATMTSLLIGMLVIPDVIYSSDRIPLFFTDYLSFHTVFFHNLVIFALFLTIALDLCKPNGSRGEVVFVVLFGTVFVAIAASMSHILDTNYSNFLHSTVGIIKELTNHMNTSIGEIPTTIIYTCTLAILHVLLLVITYYLFWAFCIIKEKAQRAIKRIKERK